MVLNRLKSLMGKYTEVTTNQVNDILSRYGLPKSKKVTPTTAGISNSNYQVTLVNGQTILLKISNDKDIQELAQEQKILLMLKKYHFPFSLAPLKTLQGKAVYEFENLHGVIFPFIKAKPPEVSTNTCRQIGQALGSLHALKLEKKDLNSIRSHIAVGFAGPNIDSYIKQDNAAPDFKHAFLNIFPESLKNIPYNDFPSGVIHGDLYYDNSLFKNDKIITLIDFEQSGRGRFILDIGIALSGSCFNSNLTNLNMKLMEEFLSGYEESRKLTELENRYLLTSVIVGFFSISLWRIKRFYEGNLDPSKKYHYQNLVMRAQNFYKRYGRES